MGHLGHMGTPVLVAPTVCARHHISTAVWIYSIFNYLDNIYKPITHITHCPMKLGGAPLTHATTPLGATYSREGYPRQDLSQASMGHAKPLDNATKSVAESHSCAHVSASTEEHTTCNLHNLIALRWTGRATYSRNRATRCLMVSRLIKSPTKFCVASWTD
jgi:hypothetical protein